MKKGKARNMKNKKELSHAIKLKGLELNLFRRNAAIAMGNSGEPSYIPDLKKVLNNDNAQVRDAAQWAIDKLLKCNHNKEEIK